MPRPRHRQRDNRRRLAAAAATVLTSVNAAFPQTPPQAAACQLTVTQWEAVASVADGDTITLESGRQIRLIGALAPHRLDLGSASETRRLAEEAKEKLESLVLGRVVEIASARQVSDRYGRELAQVFIPSEAGAVWAQGEMLKAGLARAYGLPGAFDCWRELQAHEGAARAITSGLWKLAAYQPKSASEPERLMASRSRFEIVTGRIAAVAQTKSATYLNFGTDHKSDVTLRIGKSVLSNFPDFAAVLAGLQGKEVTARGWIERRNGPMIDITDPSQIEIEPLAAAPAPAAQALASPVLVAPPDPAAVTPPSSPRSEPQTQPSTQPQAPPAQKSPAASEKPPGINL